MERGQGYLVTVTAVDYERTTRAQTRSTDHTTPILTALPTWGSHPIVVSAGYNPPTSNNATLKQGDFFACASTATAACTSYYTAQLGVGPAVSTHTAVKRNLQSCSIAGRVLSGLHTVGRAGS